MIDAEYSGENQVFDPKDFGWQDEAELRAVLDERKKLAAQIAESIPVPSFAAIFGSTARETIRSGSDLDILIATDDFSWLAEDNSEFFPQISADEINRLPSETTNISFETTRKGFPVHVEVYSRPWLEKLLARGKVGSHKSAIFDPEGRARKKEFGRWPSFKGQIIRFPRESFRSNRFLVFNDFEPEEIEGDIALRVEQAKLAFSETIRDDSGIGKAVQENGHALREEARKILGHEPTLKELTHAFTRETFGEVVPLQFTAASKSVAERCLGIAKGPEGREKEKPPLPRSLRVSVTDRCNLRCVYCMGEGNRPMSATSGETMSREQFERVMGIWASAGGKKVKYTGGEPFLNRDLPAFFAFADSLGLMQSITTNGYFLTGRNIELMRRHKVNLVVSLDTLAAGEKSKMSPVGVEARTIAERIVAAKKAGLRVEVNTVLTPYSRQSIVEEMMPWAMRNGIVLRILEEGEVIPGNATGAKTDIESWAGLMVRKYGLRLVERGKYGDYVGLDPSGRKVVYFMPSFCGWGDAASCGENSLRVGAKGEAVPCMKGDLRVPLLGRDDLYAAIKAQGRCSVGH